MKSVVVAGIDKTAAALFYRRALPSIEKCDGGAEKYALPEKEDGWPSFRNSWAFHASIATDVAALVERLYIPYLHGTAEFKPELTVAAQGIAKVVSPLLLSGDGRYKLAGDRRHLPLGHWLGFLRGAFRAAASDVWAALGTYEGEAATMDLDGRRVKRKNGVWQQLGGMDGAVGAGTGAGPGQGSSSSSYTGNPTEGGIFPASEPTPRGAALVVLPPSVPKGMAQYDALGLAAWANLDWREEFVATTSPGDFPAMIQPTLAYLGFGLPPEEGPSWSAPSDDSVRRAAATLLTSLGCVVDYDDWLEENDDPEERSNPFRQHFWEEAAYHGLAVNSADILDRLREAVWYSLEPERDEGGGMSNETANASSPIPHPSSLIPHPFTLQSAARISGKFMHWASARANLDVKWAGETVLAHMYANFALRPLFPKIKHSLVTAKWSYTVQGHKDGDDWTYSVSAGTAGEVRTSYIHADRYVYAVGQEYGIEPPWCNVAGLIYETGEGRAYTPFDYWEFGGVRGGDESYTSFTIPVTITTWRVAPVEGETAVTLPEDAMWPAPGVAEYCEWDEEAYFGMRIADHCTPRDGRYTFETDLGETFSVAFDVAARGNAREGEMPRPKYKISAAEDASLEKLAEALEENLGAATANSFAASPISSGGGAPSPVAPVIVTGEGGEGAGFAVFVAVDRVEGTASPQALVGARFHYRALSAAEGGAA